MNKKLIIIIASIVIAVCFGAFIFYNQSNKDNLETSTLTEEVLDVPTLTQEEAYSNPFILHLRTAFNYYLENSTYGSEEDVMTGESTKNVGTECGLDNFDKTYYKSKFIIWDTEPSELGGMSTYIIFIDKPDAIFWTWVYDIGDENKPEYELRAFCKNGPIDEIKAGFPEMIKAMIKDGEFPYSL